MITETMSTIGGIKTAIDMAKGISALKSEAEINQAIIDIQRTLLEAQGAAFSDKETIAKLSEEIGKLNLILQNKEYWEKQKLRYVLVKSELGAFTYNLRPEFSDDEVPHRLCTNCFDSGYKSFLHTTMKHGGGEEVICQRCDKKLKIAPFNSRIEVIGS